MSLLSLQSRLTGLLCKLPRIQHMTSQQYCLLKKRANPIVSAVHSHSFPKELNGRAGNSKNDRKENSQFFHHLPFGALLVTASGLSVAFISKRHIAHAANLDPESPFLGSSNDGVHQNRRSLRSQFNFVADVVKKVGSAVVYIERTVRVPFRREEIAVSNGSGFLIESNGLIITNAHVVENQRHVKVRLQDGREFKGQVVSVDETRDIAAIKINGRDLPSIELGNTKDLQVGEWVIAIGSPLALKNTVTAGIVSNICRAGKELGIRDRTKENMEYIQTDATINVGNSGGPLVNLDGHVIGVNTMMASAGIAFAIPIEYVQDFLQRIKTGHGTIPARRWIGIRMLSLTPDIAMQLRSHNRNLPNLSQGVYVHKVLPQSPAHLAGLRDGDVIVSLNGKDIRSAQDVYDVLRRHREVHALVVRGSEKLMLRIVAEEIPS